MSAQPAGTQDVIGLIISRAKDPAALPQVVFKIMEMTGTVDSPASAMEQAIVIDPGFSTRVLTQANSAAFALPKRVTSIKEAVLFLGFKAVRQLAMAVGLFDMFVGKTDKESLRRRGWWRHSLDSALAARYVADSYQSWNPDEAYTAGLLHYMGKTLMCRFDSKLFDKVELLVTQGAREVAAEKTVYGCDHVEVILVAGAKWGLPPSLLAGLEYIRRPESDDPFAKFKATTAVADGLARIAVEGYQGDVQIQELIPEWAFEVLEISPARQSLLIQGATSAIAAGAKMGM